MGIESEPWVQHGIDKIIRSRGKEGGYDLASRGVRDWRTQYGRCTLRNISSNSVASVQDKPVGEVLCFDIREEIDDRYRWHSPVLR